MIAAGPAHNVYTHNVRPQVRPDCIATNACAATDTAPVTSPRPIARPTVTAPQTGVSERFETDVDDAVLEALGQRT